MSLVVRAVGPEAAAAVHRVVSGAFAARPPLDPPADALAETVDTIAAALQHGGGLLAELDGLPVGALLFDPAADADAVYLRRFGVLPSHQHHGIAHRLVAAACDQVDAAHVRVLAREELPGTVGFWASAGFVPHGAVPPYVELRRPTWHRHEVVDADAMRQLGARLAGSLRAGDLVLLTGELGAGKTTFTQGLGRGLQVRGEVTSPTFVIARVHPALSAPGPDLVHVDAYRLGGLAELDDLDLDASLDEAVTVVEWGSGLAETLSQSRLEVRIDRALGVDATGPGDGPASADSDDLLDPRVVSVRGFGPRWLTPDVVGA